MRLTRPALTSHTMIRFGPEQIAEVKPLADADNKTLSTWIRDAVAAEVKRRRAGDQKSFGFKIN